MSLDKDVNESEFHARLIAEVLEAYPDKAKKRRQKHLNVAKAPTEEETAEGEFLSDCAVKSNVKSIPGVMTIRGCAYAGSKGVVWGPIKDMVHISHGPVGCGQYSWSQRRNYYIGNTGVDTFVTMQFTSDFQEKDIVFGGDKKLETIIDEIDTLFPLAKGISVQSECPIGLIGDDIEAVSRKKKKETGKTIVPVRCEGFRGVSQSLGHHIANDAIRDWVFDKNDNPPEFETTPYDVNVIGDYNIGGDAWSSRILLEEMGLRVVGNWSGDATLAEMERAPKAKLNLIHCYRSMNYICRHMEEKYGIPGWNTTSSVRRRLPLPCARSPRCSMTRSWKVRSGSSRSTSPWSMPSWKSSVPVSRARRSCCMSAVCARVTWSMPITTWAWKSPERVMSSLITMITSAPATTLRKAR